MRKLKNSRGAYTREMIPQQIAANPKKGKKARIVYHRQAIRNPPSIVIS